MDTEKVKEIVFNILKNDITYDDIVVEKPANRNMGDFAVPCFSLAKKMHKSPINIAAYLKENIKDYRTETINGYLNIFLNKNVESKQILDSILSMKNEYGANSSGSNRIVTIEYSSPNIAKPFSVGHLRTTVIGNALYNIFKKNGYTCYGINYLGDYGTQFGKLLYAYKRWGDSESLKTNPIDELKRVYVKFHEEAELDNTLEDEGRLWFKKLEDNDTEAINLWNYFKEISMKEFIKIYDILNINHFDDIDGEANYKEKAKDIVTELQNKNLLELDNGALIFRFEDMPPAIIGKSDGTSLYMTRELACAMERYNKYHFDQSIYVVGNEQTLHFKQLKSILSKMGCDFSDKIIHVNFGMVLSNGKKMSTRHGKSFKLEDLLEEAINLASKYLSSKKTNIINDYELKEAAKKIGTGAIIFNDLKNYRVNDIEFCLEDVLKFEGNTGPYVQYTYARINSLIQCKKSIEIEYDKLEINEYMWNILFQLKYFPEIIYKAKEELDPSLIAKYLLDLCQEFNKMYANEKIIDNNEQKTEYRLLICEATNIVIKEGMNLLGIEVLDKM